MDPSKNRRDFWRAPFRDHAHLTCPEGIARQARLHDISLKGALLEMGDDWQGRTGDRCQLHLQLSADVAIDMKGTVVHVDGRRMGLRCDEIDIDSITALRRLVELNAGDSDILERELSALINQPQP
jgi:hypothetical protein